MRRFVSLLFFFAALCQVVSAQKDDHQRIVIPHISPALRFTENSGQWDRKILFRSQMDGGALFIEKDALTFSFYDKKKFRAIHHGALAKGLYKNGDINFHAYRISFENSNPSPLVEKKQEGSDYENFFIGNDRSKWKSNVRNYHQVFMRDLYQGIDYEIITAVNGFKYNFYLKPGANPADIRLRYEGAEGLKLVDGMLTLKLSVNEVIEHRPYAYQIINGRTKEVKCEYRLKKNVLTFHFPEGYDKSEQLIIDPILVFAAQSGSTADNFGMTATFDAQGNLYAGGTVFNNGYPTTIGAFSSTFAGTPNGTITDIAITKYNSTGTNLLYSTYLGGNQAEIITSMIVDHANNLCFYGATSSLNFPTTTGAYDTTFNGGVFMSFSANGTTFSNGTDIYIGKFNTNGTVLIGCSFIGGSENDGVNILNNPATQTNFVHDSLQFNYGDQYRGEIQVDLANNIYFASSTRSTDYPALNALDFTLGGKQDAVVTKLNPNLTQLLYSTYLGGSDNDCGNGLVVTDNFEMYITGGTCSTDFTTTPGANKVSYSGGKADGFITHLNAAGNTALHSTYVGTASYDQSYFIQTDKYKDIYIYGQSLGNMPVIKATNASTVFNVPNTHQFITRYNSSLSNINMSTVFGNFTNTIDISPCAFSVDKCNNIYISGWGGNILSSTHAMSNMPLLQATQSTTDGRDFYFMGLDSNAQALKYGSYFGGNQSDEHVDGGTSRFDPGGRIYQSACAGCGIGGNDDWPVTPGAWPNTPGNPNHSGNCNNGVLKLDFQLQMAVSTIQTNTVAGCVPVVMTFTNGTPATGSTSTYMWYLAPGVTTSTNLNPSITYTAPGVYTVALVIKDNLTCNKKDSAITYITVHPKPVPLFTLTSDPCSNTIKIQNNSSGNLGTSPHSWNFGDGGTSTASSPSYTYGGNGNYNITYTLTDANGCRSSTQNTVSIFNFTPGAVASASACAGVGASLTASGGTSYTWMPGTGLSNTASPTPFANPNVSTTYSVIIFNNTPGYGCIDTLIASFNVLPNPVSSFSVFSDPCSNTITTSNSSSGNLGTDPYIWDFGDGSPPVTAQAPSYSYAANGTFTVKLTVTDLNGCFSDVTQTVSVFNFTPGLVSTATICYGSVTTLTAMGGTAYSWTPSGSLSNSNTSSPNASPTITTTYSVIIEHNGPGYVCSRTLTTEIKVLPTPTTNFSYSVNECGGGVHFIDQSADEIVSWLWTISPTRTSTLQNPYHFYPQGGDFTITLLTTNIYGCQHQLQKPLQVPVPPPLSVSDSVAICRGDKAQLNASGGTSYQWSPPQTLDFPAMPNPVASPSVTTEYTVEIFTDQIVNGNQCKFLLTSWVRVDVLSGSPVRATATPTLITTGESSTLVYLGDPGALVQWLPAGSTQPGMGYTVLAFPDKPTTYTAVARSGACVEDATVHVDAFSAGCIVKDFFVPNTFTPNGDRQNDVLYVRGLKIDELYFAVYNRWGEMVFETTDRNTGWDGKFKGRDADAGVFGWYLRAKCINGEESFHKGNVTLIR